MNRNAVDDDDELFNNGIRVYWRNSCSQPASQAATRIGTCNAANSTEANKLASNELNTRKKKRNRTTSTKQKYKNWRTVTASHNLIAHTIREEHRVTTNEVEELNHEQNTRPSTAQTQIYADWRTQSSSSSSSNQCYHLWFYISVWLWAQKTDNNNNKTHFSQWRSPLFAITT